MVAVQKTTTNASYAGNSIYARILSQDILNELRPLNVTRPFYRVGPAGPSAVYSFLTQTKTTIADTGSYYGVIGGASSTGYTEGTTDLASYYTPWLVGKSDVTAALEGISGFVQDQVVVQSVLDALPQFTGVLARTMAEQYETDMLSFTAFTNVSGASTSTTGMATLLAARTALAGRDVHDNTIVAILHTKAVGDIQVDVASSGSAFLANPSTSEASVLDAGLAGYVGNPFGIRIFQTSVVPTGDAGASRVGAMFATNEALGLYELWGVRTELQRDASAVGTEITLTTSHGVAKIDDTRGQTVKGSA
jgi:hypothetical protein